MVMSTNHMMRSLSLCFFTSPGLEPGIFVVALGWRTRVATCMPLLFNSKSSSSSTVTAVHNPSLVESSTRVLPW